jgi:integrase/recombinase XerD
MLVILAVASGLRNRELCGLQRRDLKLSAGRRTIKVRAENAKGKRPRSFRLSEWVAGQLRDYIARTTWITKPSSPIFVNRDGKPLNRYSMCRIVRKIQRVCELDESFTCHNFRHTFASVLYFYVGNINVVRLALGHSSLETTQRYEHGVYDPKNPDMKVFAKLFEASERLLYR